MSFTIVLLLIILREMDGPQSWLDFMQGTGLPIDKFGASPQKNLFTNYTPFQPLMKIMSALKNANRQHNLSTIILV